MDQNKEEIRYIEQYHFDKDDKSLQACKRICGVYGEDTVSKLAARKWFAGFGNFDVKDEPRSGRPIIERN